jgi:hypothetical protein
LIMRARLAAPLLLVAVPAAAASLPAGLRSEAPAAAAPAQAAIQAATAGCLAGIAAAEKQVTLPRKLLLTIGIVESGRADPATHRVAPWPWTVNAGGTGLMFPSKSDAIKAVQDLQAEGVRSIDVGCMQINLLHHPDAFASLDEAFDPQANTLYGARFLGALYSQTGNWPLAAAAYHSRTDTIGVPYETRIMAMWPLARRFPDATLQQRQLALVPAGPNAGLAEPRAEEGNATPGSDTSGFTPELAARVQQMHADFARLEARFGPPIAASRTQIEPGESLGRPARHFRATPGTITARMPEHQSPPG